MSISSDNRHRHAIMSLSALHLARFRVHEAAKYINRAVYHQALALSNLRVALMDINMTNCHAIHATGHLIVKYAFASPQAPSDLVCPHLYPSIL